MQDMNRMVRDNWEYESDDDIGEDIGKFEEEEADINIEGAAAAGGEGAPKEGAAAGGEKKEGGAGDKKEGGDKDDKKEGGK
jgi:hypothetical protein